VEEMEKLNAATAEATLSLVFGQYGGIGSQRVGPSEDVAQRQRDAQRLPILQKQPTTIGVSNPAWIY
jgi:hypothetical protein